MRKKLRKQKDEDQEKPDWLIRNERAKELEKMDPKERQKKRQKEKLDEAFKYPFCRRCRKKLDDEWVEQLKLKGAMPLCRECFEPMMEKFKENIKKFQETFSQ